MTSSNIVSKSAAAKVKRLSNDRALRMHYIGACSLLASIAGREIDEEERDLVKRCLDDCAALLGGLEVVRVSGPLGWSLEPK